MRGTPITIKGSNCSSRVDIENATSYFLSVETGQTRILVSLDGVSIGDLEEISGIGLKSVAHERMDNDGVNIETDVVVPFGDEPRISRNMEFPGAGNIVRFTTDIHASEEEEISIDPLTISGDWRRFATIIPKDDGTPSDLNWVDIDTTQPPGPILELSPPPLTLLLEDSHGLVLEISTGFDLWRWGFGQGRAKVDFRLSTTAEGALKLTRLLPANPDATKKHPHRFTWLLGWNTKKNLEDSAPDLPNIPLPLPDHSKIPLTAMASWRETRGKTPCLQTKPVRNALRKIIRSVPEHQETSLLFLNDIPPTICDIPGHLERPGAKPLPHWSHKELLDFHFWANKQLRKKNAGFAFRWNKKEKFSTLPSFKHMKAPITPGLLTVERDK